MLTLFCFLQASRTRSSVLPSASTRFLDCVVHQAALAALALTNDAVGLADASCLLLDARTMADGASEASVWCAWTSKLAPNSGVRDEDLAPECFVPLQPPDRSPLPKPHFPSVSVALRMSRRELRSPRWGGARGRAFPPNSDPVGSGLSPDQKGFVSGLLFPFERDSPTHVSGSTFRMHRKGRDSLFPPGSFPFGKENVFGWNWRSNRMEEMDVRTILRIGIIRTRTCRRIRRRDCVDRDGRRRRSRCSRCRKRQR